MVVLVDVFPQMHEKADRCSVSVPVPGNSDTVSVVAIIRSCSKIQSEMWKRGYSSRIYASGSSVDVEILIHF